MNFVSVALLVIFVGLTRVESGHRYFSFVSNGTLDSGSVQFSVSKVRSRLQCMTLCQDSATCKTVSYNPESKICQLSDSAPVTKLIESEEQVYTVSCKLDYTYNPESMTCYKLVKSKTDWYQANESCSVIGGYLATFPTAAASQWFRDQLPTLLGTSNISLHNHLTWIGGYRDDTSAPENFAWRGFATGGVPAPGQPESDWKADEPQDFEKCIAAYVDGWYDADCTDFEFFYTCETLP